MISVKIEGQNGQLRRYFTRFKVSDMHHSYQGGASNDDALLEMVVEIPGVTEVAMKDYEINIVKAPSFNWPEIEEKLFPILRGLNATVGCFDETVEWLCYGKKVQQTHQPVPARD